MVRKVSRGVSDTPFLVYGVILVVAWIAYNKFFVASGYRGFTINGSTKHDKDHYERIADQLFSEMRGMKRNKPKVYELLEGLTGNELKAVYNAFGSKNYSLFGNDGFLAKWNVTGFQLDLFGWFKKELHGDSLDEMRALWNRKKIEVTF